jgi:hypothetical protein
VVAPLSGFAVFVLGKSIVLGVGTLGSDFATMHNAGLENVQSYVGQVGRSEALDTISKGTSLSPANPLGLPEPRPTKAGLRPYHGNLRLLAPKF